MLHYLFIISVAFAQTDPPKDQSKSNTIQEIATKLTDKNPATQENALRLLGNLRTTKALPYLKRVGNSKSQSIRKAYAQALLLTPGSATLIVEQLKTEENTDIRATLLIALGKHGSTSDIDLLLSHIEPIPLNIDLLTPPVETTAALQGIGLALAIHKQKDSQLRDAVLKGIENIVRQLDSPHTQVRQAAAFALSLIKPVDPSIQQELQKKSIDLPSPHARSWLIKAIHSPPSNIIHKWYKDPSPKVRLTAIRSHPTQPFLADSTADQSTLVRLTAIEKLSSQGIVL